MLKNNTILYLLVMCLFSQKVFSAPKSAPVHELSKPASAFLMSFLGHEPSLQNVVLITENGRPTYKIIDYTDKNEENDVEVDVETGIPVSISISSCDNGTASCKVTVSDAKNWLKRFHIKLPNTWIYTGYTDFSSDKAPLLRIFRWERSNVSGVKMSDFILISFNFHSGDFSGFQLTDEPGIIPFSAIITQNKAIKILLKSSGYEYGIIQDVRPGCRWKTFVWVVKLIYCNDHSHGHATGYIDVTTGKVVNILSSTVIYDISDGKPTGWQVPFNIPKSDLKFPHLEPSDQAKLKTIYEYNANAWKEVTTPSVK